MDGSSVSFFTRRRGNRPSRSQLLRLLTQALCPVRLRPLGLESVLERIDGRPQISDVLLERFVDLSDIVNAILVRLTRF